MALWCNTSRVRGQSVIWEEPVNLSRDALDGLQPPEDAWFPDLAVDSSGRVHVVWSQTIRSSLPAEELGRLPERAFYTVRTGTSWSNPNDIIPPSREIVRTAIAVGGGDQLHLAFRSRVEGMGFTGIYHTRARPDSASTAQNWSPPRLVSSRGRSYAADLAVDNQGVLHLVSDDVGDVESPLCPGCADIFYRRSEDDGRTWSTPLNLSRTPAGSFGERIVIDPSGVIHVTWNEGYDRITGRGSPAYSLYTFSADGGHEWHRTRVVEYPTTHQVLDANGRPIGRSRRLKAAHSATAQLAVGANSDGVLLVWRTTSRQADAIYYRWSGDKGLSFDKPEELPGVFARPWTAQYDTYDMATDSAGQIHLVAVGRLSPEADAPLGVYHLEWNGRSWSAPNEVYRSEDLPEYPRIVVANGNELHTAFFTRPQSVYEVGGYNVWYTCGESDAAPVAPEPIPAVGQPPTANPISGDLEATVTPTSLPSLLPETSGLPDDIDSEADELLILAASLSPLALVGALVLLARRRRRRR